MTKFCPQCGASVNEAQRFCNKCGTSLQPTTPYAAPPTDNPPARGYAPPPPSSAPYGNVGASYQNVPPSPGQPSVPSYQTGQLPQQPNYGHNSFNLGLPTNQICSLIYLLPILGGILGLVLEPYNRDREIRFHAWQSLLLTGAWFVVTKIAIPILKFTFIPDILVGLLGFGAWLAFFGAWIYLIVQTWQGHKFRLPILGDVAEQQAQNQVKL